MHRWKWTEIAAHLVLVGAAAGTIASCTDVGGNGGAPSDDAGFDAVADDSSPAEETGALDDGALDSGAPGDLADSGPTTGLVDATAGGSDAGVADSGVHDGGAPGTAAPDAGVVDAGAPDTGAPDTGIADTGVADTGATDTGADAKINEAGGADTGTPEAGGADTGTPEAGGADTGAPDAGTHDSGTGDGGVLTTQSFLTSLGPDCLSCAQDNGCLDPAMMGGACEDAPGTATLLSGPLPDGKTCADPTVLGSASPTEKQVCFATLQMVFASKCAATLQETPCLCGATDAAMCLAGTAAPIGPGYDIFACDMDSTSATTIQSKFTNQTLGAGQANALVQCAAGFACNSCFGLP